MKTNNTLGLYIHIPFCIQKCNYCDFLSFAGTSVEVQESYVDALIKDIQRSSDNSKEVDTIFFGGGTPSLLSPEILERILGEIKNHYSLDDHAEITVEANPGTLNRAKLIAYRKMGVNRLSIGVQSMDHEILLFLGRIHNASEVVENFRLARECGFDNINIDLMFAIPGQTMQKWMDTLEQILELRPEHLSFYSLQLEKGTKFFELFEEGRLSDVEERVDRNMYQKALTLLSETGYQPYEISNAALPGRECRHNLKYWSMEDYLGLGLGAHSFIDGWRFRKEDDLTKYINDPSIVERHQNTRKDMIAEYLFTGMRKSEGISLSDFRERFNNELEDLFQEEIKRHMAAGFIEYDENKERLRFTRKGIDLSNRVLSDFV